MQSYFNQISDHIHSRLRGDQVFNAYFSGEESDFVRFNGAKVRQAGSVKQSTLHLDLIDGLRHTNSAIGLSGSIDVDRKKLDTWITDEQSKLAQLDDDPHLLYATQINSSETKQPNRLPDSGAVVSEILGQVNDLDFVGIYAAGATHRGFSNSFGQRNWLTSYSFNLDFSAYLRADKAVKSSYAGFEWNGDQFADELKLVRQKLEILKRPARTLSPGKYRTYLTPTALNDVIGLLTWGGFSEKEIRTKHSPLFRLQNGTHSLHSSFSLSENTADGIAPSFQSSGFIKPRHVPLIHEGRMVSSLISPRSAKE